MTKDEYVKILQNWEDGKIQATEDNGYGYGYFDALQQAITLAEKLDEPEKIIIPQFVDDWIEKYKQYGLQDKLSTVYWIIQIIGKDDEHFEWLSDEDNQTLFLNAIANGYEVEKDPKYKVRIKGFDGLDCTKYVNYHIPDNQFLLSDRIQTKKSKTSFTKRWLKNNWSEYKAYNNAGLLEFEEVEDE